MHAGRIADQVRRLRAGARRQVKRRLLRSGARGAGRSNASRAVLADDQLWLLGDLYEGSFDAEPIGFGMVGDFADSLDNLGGLARAGGEMQNMQRCWVVKAILGTVPRGARLLEIGADEPVAAGVLSRLGYDVTVVDPYDGSRRGPREYSVFTSAYPDLRFVRDQFPPTRRLEPGFGAVYSISVLEHVDLEQIDDLIGSVHELLGEGGCSIHAVDHVLAGWGADSRRRGLERIVAASGLDQALLAATIERMKRDAETYLVSAEAHNQRRGALAYDAYPMRRIGSVNLCRRLGA